MFEHTLTDGWPYSPLMWGCFLSILSKDNASSVFPTHVGVFLCVSIQIALIVCIPHSCGGVSIEPFHFFFVHLYSPLMWGCFLGDLLFLHLLEVFPTHVGVFLILVYVRKVKSCIPHSCGGVSQRPDRCTSWRGYSPLMWGCFLDEYVMDAIDAVFPTHVGVFPTIGFRWLARGSIPHSCGGVS